MYQCHDACWFYFILFYFLLLLLHKKDVLMHRRWLKTPTLSLLSTLEWKVIISSYTHGSSRERVRTIFDAKLASDAGKFGVWIGFFFPFDAVERGWEKVTTRAERRSTARPWKWRRVGTYSQPRILYRDTGPSTVPLISALTARTCARSNFRDVCAPIASTAKSRQKQPRRLLISRANTAANHLKP